MECTDFTGLVDQKCDLIFIKDAMIDRHCVLKLITQMCVYVYIYRGRGREGYIELYSFLKVNSVVQ